MFEKSGLGRYYNSLTRHKTSNGSIEGSRREYFSMLPCKTIEMLFKTYEEDFFMFGYDASPFFKLCKKR